jgi:hypothetical protein
LLANLQPSHAPSRDVLLRTVQAANNAGIDGLTYYNYGLLRTAQLRWIGEANRK